MKATSAKRILYVPKRDRMAKQCILEESANCATKKGVSSKTATQKMKMKGRSVLSGGSVEDQDFNWAEFCELGSSPPSMEAAKALDAMGSLLGYKVKTGDARGAYTQSLLRGTDIWVTPPEIRWPIHRERSFGGQLTN